MDGVYQTDAHGIGGVLRNRQVVSIGTARDLIDPIEISASLEMLPIAT